MSERDPHPDELLAMAWVDGELEPEAARAFETRLAVEPALRREVAALRKLEVLARSAAPPEPGDHEWEALRHDPLQRGALGAGWLLAVLGALGLGGCALWMLLASSLETTPKVCLAALVVGLTLLFLAVLRARLRLLPHDPYTEVRR
jgi:anti-sigma factor RsiW